MGIKATFHCVLWVAAVLTIAAPIAFAKSGGKEIFTAISWGDQVAFTGSTGETPLMAAEAFRKQFREYKQADVDVVLFRVDVLRWARDADWPDPRTVYKGVPPKSLESVVLQWERTYAAYKANLLKPVVDIAHQEGLKIYAYNSTFDEGMPLNEVMVEKGKRTGMADANQNQPWVSTRDIYGDMVTKFVEAHPQYVMVDRSQKKHNWGTLEFAYPPARDYAVGYNRWFLDNYPFDGIYIDFRNEQAHPEFGDEFGFAPPIVEEYQRRYGVNILREEFDLEKWRRLCGEYLTQYIRELHTMTQAHRKTLVVAIPQGNYMGPPISNMYLDWQGWVKEHIVEGLMIGVYSGSFLFPDQRGYGYLTDMEFGFGLPNLLWDLQNNYWPECAKYGVKLYDEIGRGPHPLPVADVARTNVDGLLVWDLPLLKEWGKASTH